MIESWALFTELLPEVAFKLGAAFLCGVILGLEREHKDKPAGLRTILLITMGSALFMIVSDLLPLVSEGPEATTRIDPSRIASQVVSGIGFLGAGTIIQSRGAIHGLTTAAVIWTAAGIGLMIGAGFPLMGLVVSVFVVTVLITMSPVGDWLSRRQTPDELEITIPNDRLIVLRVRTVLAQYDVEDSDITFRPYDENRLLVRALYRTTKATGSRLLEALTHIEGVQGLPTTQTTL